MSSTFVTTEHGPLSFPSNCEFSDKMVNAYSNFELYGPRFLWDECGHKALSLVDAEIVCGFLQQDGYSVQPYDFPKTIGVWQEVDRFGVPYYLTATKELISALADEHGVDYTKPSGFKVLLKDLTVDSFRNFDINEWGTHLSGVLNVFSSSPSAPVLELINTDPDFEQIKAKGIDGGDFPCAPRSYFKRADGEFTEAALNQGLAFIKRFAKQTRIDKRGNRARYNDPNHFRFMLKKMHWNNIGGYKINYWGTKISTLLRHFSGSPNALVVATINHFDDFKKIRSIGLRELDFPAVPNNTWRDKKGRPTKKARVQVLALVKALASKKGINSPFSLKSFSSICHMAFSEWKDAPTNHWGTTSYRAIDTAYDLSIAKALKDLIRHIEKDRAKRQKLYKIVNETIKEREAKRLENMNRVRLQKMKRKNLKL